MHYLAIQDWKEIIIIMICHETKLLYVICDMGVIYHKLEYVEVILYKYTISILLSPKSVLIYCAVNPCGQTTV